MNGVSTGALISLKFQEAVFFGAQQDLVKGPETMGAFVKSWVTPLEGLFDHRPPDGLIVSALLKKGLECVCNLFKSVLGGRAVRRLSACGFLLGDLLCYLLLGSLFGR